MWPHKATVNQPPITNYSPWLTSLLVLTILQEYPPILLNYLSGQPLALFFIARVTTKTVESLPKGYAFASIEGSSQ